ncbi:MAG: hypothetical protein H6816_08275 [Phycisphaerales bacterium]|nr:hypothetical protein [Phycisphaerales bacterium]
MDLKPQFQPVWRPIGDNRLRPDAASAEGARSGDDRYEAALNPLRELNASRTRWSRPLVLTPPVTRKFAAGEAAHGVEGCEALPEQAGVTRGRVPEAVYAGTGAGGRQPQSEYESV